MGLGIGGVQGCLNKIAELAGAKTLNKSAGKVVFIVYINYYTLLTSPVEICIPWITFSRKKKAREELSETESVMPFRVLDIYTLVISTAILAWLANNIVGMAFAINALSLIHLGSYWNGMLLLIGLFFYDIFWVFGTPVMVSVAKNFDAPIKLL